jgi:hypothetical protein
MKKLVLPCLLLFCGVVYPQENPSKRATPALHSPSQTSEAPKLVLSQVEELQLQILKLKRELLTCQVTTDSKDLGQQINTFADGVLQAHGHPAYILDPRSLDFVPVTPPKK